MKAPVEERFDIKNGKAQWKNRSEQGEQSVTGKAFYFPVNAPPEFTGVLARALLKAPDHKLPLLPAGEAKIEESGKLKVGEKDAYRSESLGFLLPRRRFGSITTLTRPQTCRAGSLLLPSSIRTGDTAVASSPTSCRQCLVGAPRAPDCTRSKKRSFDPQRASVRSARSYGHSGDEVYSYAAIASSVLRQTPT